MKRVWIQRSVMVGMLAAATWMAAACSIEDRTVAENCFEEEGCPPDGSGGKTGSGGAGGGGPDGGDGATPGSGGKGSGGSGGKGSGGSGGKGSGGSGGGSPGTGGRASGGTPGSGGSGGTETLAAAMRRMATANCQLAEDCAQFFVAVSFGDVAGCVERTVLSNEWYAALPGTTWNAAFFSRCADAWEGASCDEFYATTPPAACRSPGTRTNGQECNAYNQCSSYYCLTDGYDCGKCAAQPASGAPCEINADCREDELCQVSGVCAKALPEGAACSTSTADCVAPLSCYQGRCTASPYEAGDACDAANGLFCDRTYGVTCNGTQCVTIPSADTGGSCAATGTLCLDGGYCSPTGTCQAAPDSGDPCNPPEGINCKWPAICIDHFCELPQDAILCGGAGPAPPGSSG